MGSNVGAAGGGLKLYPAGGAAAGATAPKLKPPDDAAGAVDPKLNPAFGGADENDAGC